MTAEPAAAPVRRRRRAPIVIVSVVLGLAALGAAYVALDGWARQQVSDYVAVKVREVLSLDTAEPVEVQVGGASVIAQVVLGRLEEVDVAVDEVTIGELTGGVTLNARGIPTDASKPVDRVEIEFRVGEEGIQSIAQSLSAASVDSVELVDGEVRFGSEFSIFGVKLAVGVGVEPFAEDGFIGFTPSSVSLGETRTSTEALIKQFGRPAEQLLKTRSICVAEWLPEALAVEDVEVRGDALVATISARGAVFDEESVKVLGSCA